MTCSQRSTAHSLQSRGGFLSSFLSQSKKGPSRPAHPSGASPTQTSSMLLGKKEPTNHQVILRCVWMGFSIQGINLYSIPPGFCFHLKNAAQEQLLFSGGLRSPCGSLVSLPPLLLFVLQPCTNVSLPNHSSAFQSAKAKEGTVSCKDGKSHFSGLVAGESSSLQQRQKRLQEHGKERKELLSKGTFQVLGNTARLGSGGLIFL